MTLKLSVFIATSLDGYIARPDGGIDWLNQANAAVPEGEDCGFAGFMATVDVLVMGRNTFEQVLGFGEWPYGATRVVVLSRKGVEIPVELADRVSTSAEEPAQLVARLAAEGARNFYIDGGKTIQAFLVAGLINELTITTIPVLLGEGVPLFGPLESDVDLTHVATNAYPFGFVQSRYRIETA